MPVTYHAHEIREVCLANTIVVPGAETTEMDIERLNKQIGTCMTKVFGKVDEVKVGEVKVDIVKLRLPRTGRRYLGRGEGGKADRNGGGGALAG